MRSRRRLLIATSTVGGAGLVAAAIPFLESMEPSARAKAEGGPTEVEIGSLHPGELKTVVWRGKPVWLLRRDAGMIKSIGQDAALLADPESAHSEQPAACRNAYRSLQPELAVIVGVCTHLGCSPVMRGVSAAGEGSLGNDWPGGFYCPCHGSKFDFAGRVFKNVPAPTNLVIPPYQYVSSTLVRVGD
ncbi:MAG: ubiquinol-cytochrome c reductase iron-sulfur subunit [Herminiimonas sp.]|nr:ubiquinol-cytochrome c reductase iron-sulfur subunit [Herminiimonas sp.]